MLLILPSTLSPLQESICIEVETVLHHTEFSSMQVATVPSPLVCRASGHILKFSSSFCKWLGSRWSLREKEQGWENNGFLLVRPDQAKKNPHLDSSRHVFLLNNMGKQSHFHFGTNQNISFSLARNILFLPQVLLKLAKQWIGELQLRHKTEMGDGSFSPQKACI